MTKKIAIPFSGGCACGAVRYECSAPPLRMVNCHCRDCQRAGGSAYAATVVMESSAVRILQGECKEHRSAAASGNMVWREFCATCGTPLFAASMGRPEIVGVRAASLDDPSWFAAEADVWVASAQPWDHMDPNTPKFARSRPGRPPLSSLRADEARPLQCPR